MGWTGEDGWPVAFEDTATCAAMVRAIRAIPGAHVTEAAALGFARRLVAASEAGRVEEMPINRPSTGAGADSELEKLHRLCGRVIDHIAAMRRPAADGLRAEGGDLPGLQRALRQAMEAAQHAYGGTAAGIAGGRRPKIEAAFVADTAASVFESVTGKRATITVDIFTGAISGAWPDFLAAIFAALSIDASVEAQARRLMEETARN